MTRTPRIDKKKSVSAKAFEVINRESLYAFAQISPDLRIIQASTDVSELTVNHANSDEVIGKPLVEIFDEFVGAENALKDILRGAEHEYRLERVNRTHVDGSTAYLNFRILPFEEGEPAQGLLLIIEDATFNSQLEQALVQERNELRLARTQLGRANTELQQLNRLKSLFLSIAAHDLRAPLSAIRGYAEMISSGLAGQRSNAYLEFLDIICSEVDLLNHMITDFLDLDLIEQGKLVVHLQKCDLNTIVRDVSARMTALAQEKVIRLSVQIFEQASWVMGDPQRLRQIVYNLISNAIKYTPKGGQIEIVTRSDPGGGSVQVKDNGQGISPDEMANLFELYHRTDEARRSKVRGTGLGLFIVKALVNAQHGTITVTSQPGRGTTFNVVLPAPRSTPEDLDP